MIIQEFVIIGRLLKGYHFLAVEKMVFGIRFSVISEYRTPNADFAVL
ncbi:MAG: hypothetical protein ACI8P3_002635 [Saprospiraceae bacterium]|jgi:hypothetical protein